MSHESEALLEANLIKQLIALKYEPVIIKDDKALEENLKIQLEKHNKTTLSQTEFKRVLNRLNKGNVFEKAGILRDDPFALECDDGSKKYIEFLDSEHWCQNIFQVTSQVTVEGVYKNRYDVTLLINGLPLVQIELKRRGLELKEAFNQINRYQRHSYGSNNALFNYVQLFVISNGVNTKYYANNKKQSFKQTFYWADEKNNNITNLDEFTNTFLERCQLSKMICKYIVLAQVPKILMVLRPYQYHAVEAIINRVSNSAKNGYIWHTTGSGKTLTAFKTSQILMKLPKVHKVVFVVDRKDLNFQTTKEFNSFSDGSVDGTDNTKALVKQFTDDTTKLIVTTIQKLNTAISKTQYLEQMKVLKEEHVVFIFDECHRSQFGETHRNISNFFNNNQMIGFTGTPIFADNASKNDIGKRTTKDLFHESLHKYVITDAIADDNVLKFSVEYLGKYKEKEGNANNIDIEVEAIDTKELLESDQRIEKIVDYIIANHDRKTHSKEFTAMMCVGSVEMLIKYYELFKRKEHKLKIATIFSYSSNENDKDANGIETLDESNGATVDEKNINQHTREKLDEYIKDYNAMFGSSFSTKDSQSYYNYYNDISKQVKNRNIDILLVVNMFLTGFDSKTLNTLYVDKNLKYHGLIQAFSRTNRILNEQKSQGNIVCFRNLKSATDEAITLFSNENANETILMQPYEEYITKFDEKYDALIAIAPTVDSVNDLEHEEAKLSFIKAFRQILRVKNILESFSDFKWSDVKMKRQEFENYKSKYLDLYEALGANGESNTEKVSILEDVDFELELIHKDEINLYYILQLLAKYKNADDEEKKKQKEQIDNIINGNATLRSKRELIEKFINENLMQIEDANKIEEVFENFWDAQKEKAFLEICEEEELHNDELKKVIDTYLYDERKPLANDVAKTLKTKHKLLQRKKVVARVLDKIVKFVEKFYEK
ncbi:MAG: Type I restriction-modification system, restriction subunit R (EC [uncultured Sulfurovum sp.]|uniref:Type I restriction enzyme endonuclease subunit n=1 Tax=uncultured Sulfurovum sp. TaxID=269237 RepID=A0A6S6RVG0_9BACT|nr:MAG: Type I restriction-modification system, restriction subunit R (EC [uncultured Sulfurovum sp.]